jgi:hypothetical protein
MKRNIATNFYFLVVTYHIKKKENLSLHIPSESSNSIMTSSFFSFTVLCDLSPLSAEGGSVGRSDGLTEMRRLPSIDSREAGSKGDASKACAVSRGCGCPAWLNFLGTCGRGLAEPEGTVIEGEAEMLLLGWGCAEEGLSTQAKFKCAIFGLRG